MNKQLEKWAKNILGDDYDKFDIKAEADNKISLSENKTLLREKFKVFLKDIKPTKQEIKSEQEKAEYEQLKQFKEAEEQAVRVFEADILEKKNQEMAVIEKYKVPIEYIKSVARGFNRAFIFLGDCGLGKSYITQQILAQEGVKFDERSGVISPLAFYTYLSENSLEEKVLVLDDIAGLISNPASYSTLLSALWGGIVKWSSTSGKLKVPQQFNFKGRIIVIANKLKKEFLSDIDKINNSDIVRSRCLTYKIELNWKERIEMMYNIAKIPHKSLTKEERFAIVDFIKDNSGRTTDGLDLRTQVKAENLYLYNKENWKELVKSQLPKHSVLECLEMCLNTSHSIKEAEVKFCEETGLSRPQFFRLKNKLTTQS